MDFTIAKYRPDVKNTDGEDDVTNTLTNQESDAEEAAPTNWKNRDRLKWAKISGTD